MNIPSNIYNFSDYRDFLKDRYRQLKEQDPMFSFRFFSKQAGFGSPNYLKLVMDGKRNLSEEAIGKFARGLRLDNHESEFFRFMVEFNQCDSIQKKRVYEAKLLYLRELFKVKSLIPELYDYYHEWYHSAIREMVKKARVRNHPGEIATSLVPPITEAEATASVELLKKLKFIDVTHDGWIENREVAAGSESENRAVAQKIHYEQMAELAAESLYTQGPDTQGFESVTVSLPASKMAELRTKIGRLIQEAVSTGSQNPSDAVYQLNIQLFALTKGMGKRSEETTEQVA